MQTKEKIGIIGLGAEGNWWLRFLESLGHDTKSSSRPETNQAVVDWAEIILLCVPMSVAPSVILSIQFRSDQLVICAVGEMIESGKALANLPCEWVQVHRMSGPTLKTMKGQNMLVGRNTVSSQWLLCSNQIIDATEAVVTNTFPIAHDKATSVTQCQLRLDTIASLFAMQRIGIKPSELKPFSSPPFRIHMAVCGRLLKQGPELCFDMLSSNTFAPGAIKAMREAIDQIQSLIEAGDKAGFVRLFNSLCEFVGDDFITSANAQVDAIVEKRLDFSI